MNNVQRKNAHENPPKKGIITNEQLISVLEIIAYSVCGFLYSRGTIFGQFAPLGIAFAAAVPRKGLMFVACAVIASTIFPTTAGQQLRYLTAITAVVGARWAIGSIKKIANNKLSAPIAVFSVLMITGFFLKSRELIISDIVLIISESIIAASATFFMKEATVLLEYKNRAKLKEITPAQTAYIIIASGLLITCASSIQFEGMSPARAVAVTAVLIASYIYKEKGGSIAGIAAGISISLAGDSLMFFGGAYAFGGLMAGVFSHVGKIAAGLAFLMASAVSGVITGGGEQVIAGIYEIIIGCLVFICIPRSKMNKFIKTTEKVIQKEKIPINDMAFRQAVSIKLRTAAIAVEEVSNAVEKVSKSIAAINGEKQKSLSFLVKEKLCLQCQYYKICHESGDNNISELLTNTEHILKENGILTTQILPMRLSKKCQKPSELTAAFNSIYDEQLYRSSADRKITEMREMMADQLKGLSGLLADLCINVNKNEKYNGELSQKVTEVISKMGINIDEACCIFDSTGRISISVYTLSEINMNDNQLDKLSEKLSLAVGKKLERPQITTYDNTTVMLFREKTEFKMKIGAAQHTYKDGKLCGDAYKYFNDGSENSIFVISDGMGTGPYAALDGELTSGILTRLIKAGFRYDSALKIINSAMLLKSGDESLATIDLANINLETGKLDILKAGAPPTLIRREGKIERINCSSLPVGILNDVSFEKNSVTMKKGDILLMFSDGALGGGTQWLEQELLCFVGDDVQMLAERIVRESKNHRMDGRDDDVTVIAAMVA